VAAGGDHEAAGVAPVGAGGAEAVVRHRLDALPQGLVGTGQAQLAAVAGGGLGQPAEQLELEADDVEVDGAVRAAARCGQEALPAAQADVVLAALEHRHLRRVGGEQVAEDGDVLLGELFLQGHRVGGDHRASSCALSPEGEGEQVGERLADAGAGLDEQAAAALQGLGDGAGHLDLSLPVLVALDAAGERAAGAEQGGDLVGQIDFPLRDQASRRVGVRTREHCDRHRG
jgi:hypothetical protein